MEIEHEGTSSSSSKNKTTELEAKRQKLEHVENKNTELDANIIYSEMSDDEIVGLCLEEDRTRATKVVNKLRAYLVQVYQSNGFDVDEFPGWFKGVTSIYPSEREYSNPYLCRKELMCKTALFKYNSKNVENKTFEFLDVEKINIKSLDYYYNYYITFRAREVQVTDDANNQSPDEVIKTFQAAVKVHRMPPRDGFIAGMLLCRPKPVV